MTDETPRCLICEQPEGFGQHVANVHPDSPGYRELIDLTIETETPTTSLLAEIIMCTPCMGQIHSYVNQRTQELIANHQAALSDRMANAWSPALETGDFTGLNDIMPPDDEAEAQEAKRAAKLHDGRLRSLAAGLGGRLTHNAAGYTYTDRHRNITGAGLTLDGAEPALLDAHAAFVTRDLGPGQWVDIGSRYPVLRELRAKHRGTPQASRSAAANMMPSPRNDHKTGDTDG